MYILNSSDEVKYFVSELEKLSNIEKLQVLIPIMEQWSNNQINSENECNPNLIDDEKLIIFNPTSIDRDISLGTSFASVFYVILQRLGVSVSEVVENDFDSQLKHSKKELDLLSYFEKLSFKDKIDVITEIILLVNIYSFDENSDSIFDAELQETDLDTAKKIMNYKKELFSNNGQTTFPYDIKE